MIQPCSPVNCSCEVTPSPAQNIRLLAPEFVNPVPKHSEISTTELAPASEDAHVGVSIKVSWLNLLDEMFEESKPSLSTV
jgi:hypothetical protein